MDAPRPPTFLATLSIVGRGYLPRLLQARGWVVCGLALLPVLLVLGASQLLRGGGADRAGLYTFHVILAMGVVPILALVAAPAGLPEDLEQRTLPLLLARPCPARALPLARGLPWFLGGGLWLALAGLGLGFLGQEGLLAKAAALVAAFWAELAFVTLLVMVFRRGIVWSALVLLVWDPLVQFMPGNLQRATFIHYVQSISGSRGSGVGASDILAQEQIATPLGLAILALVLFGALCWALCGWRLQSTPVGLAGPESEG